MKKIDVQTPLEVHSKYVIMSTFKEKKNKGKKTKTRILNTFKIKKKKRTKNYDNMGIISTMANMKTVNFGEHKELYVKYGVNDCKFV